MLRLAMRRNGFSLVEILLLLGLVSILLVAALIAYPQVRERNYVNTERQRLLKIVSVIRPVFAFKPTYDGLTTDSANAVRAFDVAMNNDNYAPGQVINHSWGGVVLVGPATDNRFMRITYADVPPEACVKLATGVARNFWQLYVEGNLVWQSDMGLDYDITNVVAQCSADPDGVSMAFIAD